MYRFEDGAVGAEVRARHQSQPAHERRAQIRDDVAVQVLQQQHVVLVGIHHQLHAGVVHDVLAVGDLRDTLAKPLREHLMNRPSDIFMMLALWMAWIFLRLNLRAYSKANLRNARRGLLGDDLQALDYAGHHFVLDARVQAFGIFANHDQIDIGILRRHARQVDDRPEIGEQLELLAQGDVDAGKSAAHRSRDRPLEPDVRALDRLGQFLRDVFLVLRVGFGAGGETLPLELDAGASRMRTLACTTSGPMPSPGINVTVYAMCSLPR